MRAHRHGRDDMAARGVPGLDGRAARRRPLVTPLPHGRDHGPEIAALAGEPVFRAPSRLSFMTKLGESVESVAPPVRRREVTWQDPLVSAALARDLSGLDYLLGIAEGRFPPPPIAALLGMSILSVAPGQVTFCLDVGEHLYNPIGSVHGGVFCTLLDSAMGCSVHASLDRGQAYTTLELKVNIVKALTLNTPSVTATGKVISAGRRVATASGQITGPDGALYAHATTTCLVFGSRPTEEKGSPGRSGKNGRGR